MGGCALRVDGVIHRGGHIRGADTCGAGDQAL